MMRCRAARAPSTHDTWFTMYAAYIVKRTQIYLDEAQELCLADRAEATGRTKSELIRDAVDSYLAGSPDGTGLARFRSALRASAGSAPRLPAGSDYVDEQRGGERRRRDDVEQHRGRA